MRIAIDMQGAQSESRYRGIGRYTISLAKAIVNNKGGHEVILVLSGLFPETIDTICAEFNGLLPRENIRVWFAPGQTKELEPENNWRRESAEILREAFLLNLNLDIILVMSLFEGFVDDVITSIKKFDVATPIAVILYDLIPFADKKTYLGTNHLYNQHYLRKIEYFKKADLYLAISENSAKDAKSLLNIDKARIVNIGAACGEIFRPDALPGDERNIILNKFKIIKPFIMYTGDMEGRKNIDRLVNAYTKLSADIKNKHQLVLVGKISNERIADFIEEGKKAGISEDELIFTGYVNDYELVALYSLCSLFVFPSLHEGFGLPPLEAMSCGAPVIGAMGTATSEVIGLSDALFDPLSVNSMVEKMSQVLNDVILKDKLIEHGISQAKNFSWDNSAKKAILALEKLAAEKTSNSVIISSIGKPKLAYISPLPPERSGISDYSAEILRHLSAYYGIEIIVDQDEVTDAWINENYKKRTVSWFNDNANNFDRILYHFGNSYFHKHMFNLLERFPGVVVLHDFFLYDVYRWMDEVYYSHNISLIDVIYKSHGFKAVKEYLNNKDSLSKYPLNINIIENSVGIIGHSNYLSKLLEQWYGKNSLEDFALVPFLKEAAPKIIINEAKGTLNIESDCFVICSFGFIDNVKLNIELLNAFLNSKLSLNEKCFLFFVGENQGGDYGINIANIIRESGLENRIRITGYVEPMVYKQYLSASDMAIQLRRFSKGETSAAVFDCMSFGIPTIVSTNGSIGEIPKDCAFFLPEKFDDKTLVNAIEKLYDNKELRHTLGKKTREFVNEKHNPQYCAKQYFNAIEKFYSRKPVNLHDVITAVSEINGSERVSDAELMNLSCSIAYDFPSKKILKQILVDISSIINVDLKTGIERVTKNILKELIDNPPDGFSVEPVYAIEDESGYRYARKFTLKSFDYTNGGLTDDIVEVRAGDIFLGLDFAPHSVIKQKDYLLAMRWSGVRIYFIVYDILPVLMPEVFPPGTDIWFRDWLKTIMCFDGAICISKTVSLDLKKWIDYNVINSVKLPFYISWFHLGHDIKNLGCHEILSKNQNELLPKLSRGHTFLMVGTIEPRKGHLQALDAFNLLWEEGFEFNLIFIGQEGWKPLDDEYRRTIPEIVKTIRENSELNKRLFWLEDIDDGYLEKIYQSSSCIIAASYGEGFGLPLIEAASKNTHIIARDIPVFREVAGEHAYYFNGLNPEDLADAVKKWVKIYEAGDHPKSKNIKVLTWKESASNLVSALLKQYESHNL